MDGEERITTPFRVTKSGGEGRGDNRATPSLVRQYSGKRRKRGNERKELYKQARARAGGRGGGW